MCIRKFVTHLPLSSSSEDPKMVAEIGEVCWPEGGYPICRNLIDVGISDDALLSGGVSQKCTLEKIGGTSKSFRCNSTKGSRLFRLLGSELSALARLPCPLSTPRGDLVAEVHSFPNSIKNIVMLISGWR